MQSSESRCFQLNRGQFRYLVLQEYTSAHASREVVNIVDWEASTVEVHAELLQAAMKLVPDRRMVIWTVSIPTRLIAVLEKVGFKRERQPQSALRQPYNLLVRPIGDEETEGDWVFGEQRLLDMKSWDLRMLYSMHG